MMKLIEICSLKKYNEQNKDGIIEYWKSLKTLTNFLFSFVFGFGLTRLNEVFDNSSKEFVASHLFMIILAYLAIMLSWWGYNWAASMHSWANNSENSKRNFLHHIIDCLLLFSYWSLLNFYSKSIQLSFGLYTTVFFLYFLWDLLYVYLSPNDHSWFNMIKSIVYLTATIVVFVTSFHIVASRQWILIPLYAIILLSYRLIRCQHYLRFRDKFSASQKRQAAQVE